MTDKPHSGESEYDDPLSLFAPEAAAPPLDDELLADDSAYRASEAEHEGAPGLQFHVEHQAAFRSAAASMPPPPFWRRHGSGTFALFRLTIAISAIGATVFVIGWLLTSGSEPVHTAGDAPGPVPARTEPSAVIASPQPRVEPPAPRAEKPPRDEASVKRPPANAAPEPARTPAPESITRTPFNNASVTRDQVTPAARVAPPPTPSIVSPPVSSPLAASSVTSSAAPTTAPPVTASPPPAADSAVTTTLPATPPPSVPAAIPASSAPVVEAETARAAPPTLPPPERGVRPRSERIKSTLEGYREAVGALNPTAVRAVWPKADVKALTKAFSGLQEQKLQLDNCTTESLGLTAAYVTCTGTLSVVRNVGSKTPLVVRSKYEFSLREENDSWVIDRVITR